MNGRQPNRHEKKWLDLCVQVPCIVCAEWHGADESPAEIHHIRGQKIPGAHFLVLSLCAKHHRHADCEEPKRWVSRHGDGKAAFERRYAKESELLEIQSRYVENVKERTV